MLSHVPLIGHPLFIDARILDSSQAMKNHGGQSLERLCERGGLSLCEAAAIAEKRAWHRMTTDEALAALKRSYERFMANPANWHKA